MPSLTTVESDAEKVAAIIQVISPLTGEVVAIGTAVVSAVQAIGRLVHPMAVNADGTPLTDAQLAAHFAGAQAADTAVIQEADKDLAEDAARAATR